MNNYPDDWNIKTLDEVCSRIWIGLVTTMTKFYVKKTNYVKIFFRRQGSKCWVYARKDIGGGLVG